MSAKIINLADRQRGDRKLRGPSKGETPLELLRDIAGRLGLPPLEEEPAPPPPQRPTILEMIQEIADELGIDIEAPFRQARGPRPFVVPQKPGRKPRKSRQRKEGVANSDTPGNSQAAGSAQ